MPELSTEEALLYDRCKTLVEQAKALEVTQHALRDRAKSLVGTHLTLPSSWGEYAGREAKIVHATYWYWNGHSRIKARINVKTKRGDRWLNPVDVKWRTNYSLEDLFEANVLDCLDVPDPIGRLSLLFGGDDE
jgi:hypothetical protein